MAMPGRQRRLSALPQYFASIYQKLWLKSCPYNVSWLPASSRFPPAHFLPALWWAARGDCWMFVRLFGSTASEDPAGWVLLHTGSWPNIRILEAKNWSVCAKHKCPKCAWKQLTAAWKFSDKMSAWRRKMESSRDGFWSPKTGKDQKDDEAAVTHIVWL